MDVQVVMHSSTAINNNYMGGVSNCILLYLRKNPVCTVT